MRRWNNARLGRPKYRERFSRGAETFCTSNRVLWQQVQRALWICRFFFLMRNGLNNLFSSRNRTNNHCDSSRLHLCGGKFQERIPKVCYDLLTFYYCNLSISMHDDKYCRASSGWENRSGWEEGSILIYFSGWTGWRMFGHFSSFLLLCVWSQLSPPPWTPCRWKKTLSVELKKCNESLYAIIMLLRSEKEKTCARKEGILPLSGRHQKTVSSHAHKRHNKNNLIRKWRCSF